MAHALRSPNRFEVEKARLGSLIEEVAQRVQRREIETEEQLFHAVYGAYRRLYENIATPVFSASELDPYALRTPELINKPFREIGIDLRTLYKMTPMLVRTIQDGFNYVQALEEMVRERLKLGAQRSVDLKILTGSLRRDMVVAGDDFYDLSKTDVARVAPGMLAEQSPFGGYLTLRRVNTKDLREEDEPTLRIAGPAGMYEGKLYALVGQAEPEGSKFEFTTTAGSFTQQPQAGVDPEIRSRFEVLNAWLRQDAVRQTELGVQGELSPEQGLQRSLATGAFGGLTRDEWEQLSNNAHYERVFVQASAPTPFDPRPDDSTGFRIDLAPSPEDDREVKRRKMLDRSADTYWQAELTFDTTEEFNRVKLLESQEQVGAVPERTLEEIRQTVQAQYDPRDFEISIVIDLGGPKIVNYITIHPYLPDPTCTPEVVSIESSVDGVAFDEISEIKDGRFELRLTADVNSELSREEVALSLAANGSQYHGQGVFAFVPREVRFIRLKLRERVPIPAPYSALRFLQTRTITTQVKKERAFGETTRRKTVDQYQRHITLNYLESLYLLQNEESSEQLKAETDPGGFQSRGGLDFWKAAAKGASFGALGGVVAGLAYAVPVLAVVGAVIGAVAGALSTKTRVRQDDTGWQIAEMSSIVKYDKARYCIGIREIGIFQYVYAPQSEIVSIPFRSPKPISTVSLEVDDAVPEELLGPARAIEYYFSVDDGTTWNRIAPLNSSPRREAGVFIPQIYHVNSPVLPERRDQNVGYVDIVGQRATQVRFRALLKGDSSRTGITPVLKAYRLLLGTEGGMRG